MSKLGEVKRVKYDSSSEEGWRVGASSGGGSGAGASSAPAGEKHWMEGSGLTPLMKPRAWSNSDRSIVSSIASGNFTFLGELDKF